MMHCFVFFPNVDLGREQMHFSHLRPICIASNIFFQQLHGLNTLFVLLQREEINKKINTSGAMGKSILKYTAYVSALLSSIAADREKKTVVLASSTWSVTIYI